MWSKDWGENLERIGGEVFWKAWPVIGSVGLSCGVEAFVAEYGCRMSSRIDARIWCAFRGEGT